MVYTDTIIKPKHIYWFSHYNFDAPSVRYRARYALEEMRKQHGITYSFVVPGYSLHTIFHFLKIFLAVLFFRKKDSLLVFQRIYSNKFYASALKMLLFFRTKNTLYDLDDAEYLNFPPETINHFMKNCSACSVGSKALMDYAGKFNATVFLLTSPVIAHHKIKANVSDEFTIGWIGFYNTDKSDADIYSHKKSLATLFFPALLDIDFKIKFVLLGVTEEYDKKEIRSYFSLNKNVSVEIPGNINWQDELSIYERIKEFDIGISPLLDHESNRAKSAFKLKQYFSCAVPALGSRVGENAAFLQEGVNGYFCESPADYKKRIQQIKYLPASEYKILCSNAKKSVPRFSLENYCFSLLKCYGSEILQETADINHIEYIAEIS